MPQGTVVKQSASGASPSVSRAVLLLGLGVLVAAGLAGAARLAARRR